MQLGIGESALRKRLKVGHGVSSLGRFKRTFNDEQENELAKHCKDLDNRFYGISFKKLQQLAYQFALKNDIEHRFNEEKQLAGYDWANSFIVRHDLSLRTPQKTSVARIMGFNRYQINRFYDNLKTVYQKLNVPPSRIFNMDETGILTVPNKVPKVISSKGKKIVGKSVAAERGELVTAVCCFSASGIYVPPILVFPRKRMKEEYLNGAPPETLGFLSDSGYINSDLFLKWLEHFKHHVKPSEDSPVLLILDNHTSHININTITYCRTNFIHLVSIPPHSSHRTQPLDRCFFKPLKDYYAYHYDIWTTTHPGRVVTLYQLAEIFGNAYGETATMSKALNAFQMCGIWPLNPNIFSDDDFLPSTVTDQTVSEDPQNDQPLDILNMPIEFVNDEVQLNQTVEEQSTSSLIVISSNISTEPIENSILQASTSKIIKSPVSPADIIPLPKISLKRKRRAKGKKSEILSSTPYKIQLETLEKDKENAKLISEKKKQIRKQEEIYLKLNQNQTRKKYLKKLIPLNK